MFRLLYSCVYLLLIPVELLRLLFRSIKSPGYRQRINERFASFVFPKEFVNGIWIHAVSVGETVAAASLVNELLKQKPNEKIIFTTTTVTGSNRVRSLLGNSVFHVYSPYDLPLIVKKFFQKTQPKLLVIMETEIWPNMVYFASKNKIPIILANARLSEKSYKNYAKINFFLKSILQKINLVAAQSNDDAGRFISLGVNKNKIIISGSIKFDFSIPENIVSLGKNLREKLGKNRPVWIAASTRENEEIEILNAHKIVRKKIPDCLLILVPRHPERFNIVASLAEKNNFKIARRSTSEECRLDTSIYLGDTMGEMLTLYAAADIAFVGGSLVPTGGQNILEPAALSLPIIVGPHTYNFAAIIKTFNNAGAIQIVANTNKLAEKITTLFSDEALRKNLGIKAKKILEKNKGALQKIVFEIEKFL